MVAPHRLCSGSENYTSHSYLSIGRFTRPRSLDGRARVYTITVACTDSSGNTRTKTVTVTVPKSQGK
jgi:hypothetical protein